MPLLLMVLAVSNSGELLMKSFVEYCQSIKSGLIGLDVFVKNHALLQTAIATTAVRKDFDIQ